MKKLTHATLLLGLAAGLPHVGMALTPMGPAALAPLAEDTPATTADYPLNFPPTAVPAADRADRYTASLALNGSTDGNQTIVVGKGSPNTIYRALLDRAFTAKAGERLTPVFNYSGGWMNGYVYLDCGNDGTFSARLNSNYTIAEGCDLMTYSYYETVENTEGYKSDGTKVSGGARNFLNPPAFTLPSGLKPSFYRMRFKVDWGNIDPGGRYAANDNNNIVKNGGSVVDVRLNIHEDECSLRVKQTHGRLTDAKGQPLAEIVPFGKAITLKVTPDEGYMLDGLRVRHGHGLDGDSLVHGTPQYVDEIFPAYLFSGDSISLPAGVIDGEVRLEALFVPTGRESAADYGLNFPDGLQSDSTAGGHLAGFRLTGQGRTTNIALPADDKTVYHNLTAGRPTVVPAGPGQAVNVSLDYPSGRLHAYLYVDLNQDGRFAAALDSAGRPTLSGELLTYNYYQGRNSSGTAIDSAQVDASALPSFTLPANLPTGVYRARLKVDWNSADPGGNYEIGDTSSDIAARGGHIVDFLLNVHAEQQALAVETRNGSINGPGNTGLPLQVPCFQALTVVPTPAAAGYVAPDGLVVRHGHHLDGPQYIHGNRQWSEYVVRLGAASLNCLIPKDSVDGDVRLSVKYEAGPAAEYQLVFSDEFELPDGSQPNEAFWSRSPRQSSTWNRWLSDSKDVIYVKDGMLVARAIPNTNPADKVPMITGGIQTSGKFSYKYGKIEARLRTNPHKGNFPAFWLMPQDQRDGWPKCGEIDIFEQIDNENKSYHTIHSNWSYNLGHKWSRNRNVQMDRFHTYGFEWDERSMKWYVDGYLVGTYTKSSNQSELNNGQWPFDKAFYIILNQSVGNGSWASPADESHTYETLFDWVRVYQKPAQMTGITDAPQGPAALEATAVAGGISLRADRATRVAIYDAAGRHISTTTVSGTRHIGMAPGLYLVNGQKVLVP